MAIASLRPKPGSTAPYCLSPGESGGRGTAVYRPNAAAQLQSSGQSLPWTARTGFPLNREQEHLGSHFSDRLALATLEGESRGYLVIDWKELRPAAGDWISEGILEWKEEISFEVYCEQLRVEAHADDMRLQQAYRKLALLNHPDLQPPHRRAEAEQRMKQLNEAYRVLRQRKQAGVYAEPIPDRA